MDKIGKFFKGKANKALGNQGENLLSQGTDLYLREKSALEETSQVTLCVVICQFVANLAIACMYAFFLFPFKYKNYVIGHTGKECFSVGFTPDVNSSIEQVYSPYQYTGTAEEFQTQIDNGDITDDFVNVSKMYLAALTLLASGQVLFMVFNLTTNLLAYCG